MVTEQEEILWGYLLDPTFQLVNSRGAPLTNGWIEVYIHGTRNKYYCASDFDGTLHPFKIPLDSLGSNIVLADPNRSYDVYVYNRFGSLEMSRYNVSPGHASGTAVIGGGDAEHWLGRDGSVTDVTNNVPKTLELPQIGVDYDGSFIDHINTQNTAMYLKPGIYLINAVVEFKQDGDDLTNTIGQVQINTGLDNVEDQSFDRNETGPDAGDGSHYMKVMFIRHVTGEDDGSDVLHINIQSPNDLSMARIWSLQIAKLGGGSASQVQPIEYSAGQYIDIDGDVINVTGLQPAGNYQPAGDYVERSEMSGYQPAGNYVNQSTYNSDMYDVHQTLQAQSREIDEVSGALDQKADRSDIPSLEGYATESWVQNQHYLTSVPDQYATDQEVQAAVSGKADKSEIPSLDGYATETYVQEQVSGKQDDLTFTYDSENKITSIDGHGIAGTGGGGGGGSEYIPGQYISIQNDIISVTGLQPSGDYQPAGDYLTQDDLNGYVKQEELSSYATDDDVQAAVSGKADKSEIPSLSGYATEEWVGQQGYLTSVPSEFITETELESELSGKADKSEIPSVAGLASETYVDEHIQSATSGKADKSEIPSLAGYATQDWVNQQGFVDDDDVIAATSGKMDASAYTAPVNADWSATSGLSQILNKPETEEMDVEELQAGEYISIQSGVISVTGLSGSGGGSTYSAGQYISIQNDVITATGLQPAGEYLVPDDLNGYATTEDVEAATSGKLDASAYTAPVKSDWNATSGLPQILNKPEASLLLAGQGISITESGTDYVISSTGGGPVPEGVMTESELKYNAVGEISGYGDSAIAQYGAEKQWLVHDDTIVHQSNSAQYAFGVNISATSQLMGVDETVLWTGTANVTNASGTLSESIDNFEYVEVYAQASYNPNPQITRFKVDYNTTNSYRFMVAGQDGAAAHLYFYSIALTGTSFSIGRATGLNFSYSNLGSISLISLPGTADGVVKIVGIGRKQST